MLKVTLTTQGYCKVTVYGEAGKLQTNIGTLILRAFIGPKPEGQQCRHKNGNKLDNRPHNLQWGTPQENADDKRVHGTILKGAKNPNAQLTSDQVNKIKEQLDHKNNCQLGREYGVSRETIRQIRIGSLWKVA